MVNNVQVASATAKNSLGIDRLTATLVDAIIVGKDLELSLGDGIQTSDAFVLVASLPRLKNIVTNARPALKELADLSPDEAAMLEERILAQTGILTDGRPIIVIARDAMHLCVRTYRLAKDVKYLVDDWRDMVSNLRN